MIEVGVPGTHMTTIDHTMMLPTGRSLPNRDYQGQRFCHHKLSEAAWTPSWRLAGFEQGDTGVQEATSGLADVRVARRNRGSGDDSSQRTSHDRDIVFMFVMEGRVEIEVGGHGREKMGRGEGCTIPPHVDHQLVNCSDYLELMEVSLGRCGKM